MKQKQKKSDSTVAPMREIVQFPLLPEEATKVSNWVIKPDQILLALADYIERGLRFELSSNPKKKGYSVLVKFSDPDSPNAGSGFYSNGETLEVALVVAMLKLNLLGNNTLSDFLSERTNDTSFS